MIGRTNAVCGGGGLSPRSAVIHVTAPVGSTISFSKGGVVAKVLGPEKSHVNAENTSLADWYYSVSPSNFGTWTVTATLGNDTVSDTVTVNAAKEYDVTLEYGLILFNYGATDYTFSASRSHSSYGSGGYQIVDDYLSVYAQWAQAGGGTYTNFYCTTAVDASKYSTIEVEYKSNYSSTISIRSSPNGSDLEYVVAAINTGTTPVKAVLDISGIVSQVYFAVRISAAGATKNSINMYKITFKP